MIGKVIYWGAGILGCGYLLIAVYFYALGIRDYIRRDEDWRRKR